MSRLAMGCAAFAGYEATLSDQLLRYLVEALRTRFPLPLIVWRADVAN